MCNQFHGQGKLSDGELKVKDMAMTRMMCADPQLNALDGIVSDMFKQGAQVDLTADQLTLATAEQTLTYKLAEFRCRKRGGLIVATASGGKRLLTPAFAVG